MAKNPQSSSTILEHVLYKVSQCIDYQNLYALEEDLNKIGLTIQTTARNRMILCKLRNGRRISESIIDDYIFIGSLGDLTREISEATNQKISDFIRNKAGAPSKLKNMARVWRNGLRMYESVLIVNEDVNKIAGDIGESELLME